MLDQISRHDEIGQLLSQAIADIGGMGQMEDLQHDPMGNLFEESEEFHSCKVEQQTLIEQSLNIPITPESLSPASTIHEPEIKPAEVSTLVAFFSNLKTNYLRLCNSYNFLLLKLSDCEMDRSKLYEENMELKKLLKYMIDVNNSDPSRKPI